MCALTASCALRVAAKVLLLAAASPQEWSAVEEPSAAVVSGVLRLLGTAASEM